MAKSRMINTRFWIDDYTSNLDPIEKLLFLYLLTNTATEICGVYELPLKIVAVETGIDKEMVEKIVKRFTKDKKIFYIKGWVYVVNFTKHQTNNPSVETGIERCLNEVPREIIQAVDKLLASSTQSGTLNLTKLNLTKPNLTKLNFSSKDMKMVDLLISLIQQNTPSWNFKGNKETWAEHIEKLHRIDNRSYENIELMIRWVQQDSFWKQNILSTSKLREKFNDLIPRVMVSAKGKGKKIIGLDD